MSMHVSSGLVGVSSHTIAVSSGQSPARRVEVGEVDRASTASRAAPTPWRSGGTCRRRRRCRAAPARPARARRSTLSSAARPLAKARPWRRPPARPRTPRARRGSGCPTREYSKPLCPPTPSWANVVRQRDRRDDGAGGRVGLLAGVDGPGLEAPRPAVRRCSPIDRSTGGDGLEVRRGCRCG